MHPRYYWINDGTTTHGAAHTCRTSPGDTYTAVCGATVADSQPGMTKNLCPACDTALVSLLRHPQPGATRPARHLAAV